MIIIIYGVRIQQRIVLLVMKEEVAFDAKITRILLSPLIVFCHLRRMIYFAHGAFSVARPELEGEERIVSLILDILRMYHSHVPNNQHVLAISLHHFIFINSYQRDF